MTGAARWADAIELGRHVDKIRKDLLDASKNTYTLDLLQISSRLPP